MTPMLLRARPLASAALLLLSLPGCDRVLAADVEVDSICSVMSLAKVEATPVLLDGPVRFALNARLDLGGMVPKLAGLEDPRVTLQSAQLLLEEGRSLEFIDALELAVDADAAESAASTRAAAEPHTVATYQKPEGSAVPITEATMQTDTEYDLAPLMLESGLVDLRIGVAGRPPQETVGLAVRLCLGARANYAYGRAL